MRDRKIRNLLRLVLAAGLCGLTLYTLSARSVGYVGVGSSLDPWGGFIASTRTADKHPNDVLFESLSDSVAVVYNERGVPQIFASSDRDAIMTLGYVVARDRLFQLDFVPRVASGRLAEVLGSDAIESDRFLRSTGMEFGAQLNHQRIDSVGGIERDLLSWYALGVNSFLKSINANSLPFEFRLLGYAPREFEPIDAIRVLQYMSYDLSFRGPDAARHRFASLDR
ncbi:MAG: hypothetical protein HKN13_02330, partial [Rhodothermales bacterium]|nr:hypothetical protein [Rhodothermales bacterium]